MTSSTQSRVVVAAFVSLAAGTATFAGAALADSSAGTTTSSAPVPSASAPTPATPSTTSGHSKRLEDQTQEFGHTVAKGAGAGAVIGGLIGLAIGRDAKSAAKGAVIGGVLGAASGYYIAGQQRKFANQAQALEAISADLRKGNEDLATMAQTAEAMLAEDRERVSALRLQVASAEVKRTNADSVAAQLEADRKVLGGAIDVAQKRLATSRNNVLAYEKQYSGGSKDASLGTLLTGFEAQNTALTHTNTQMTELLATVPRATPEQPKKT